MIKVEEFLTYLQVGCTFLALFNNSFLIYIVKKNKKSVIGAYKYLLIIFALFEMTYALVVLIGMPIHFIVANSWLVFNYDGLIGRTSFNWLGPTLYCSFYYLWVGLVDVHFIYRINLKRKIEDSWKWKALFAFVYALHFVYSFVCGIYYCTRSEMSKHIQDQIRTVFEVEEPETIGFILLRIKDLQGQINIGGLISILNHYVNVGISAVIIGFCSINIWRTIKKMQIGSFYHKRDVSLQRQMFITLVIQTAIPCLLCHLPTLLYLVGTSPFVSEDFSLGAISPIFSFLTTFNKVLDPIVIIFCIREYRQAALNILGGGKYAGNRIGTISSSSEGRFTTHGAARHTEYEPEN